MLDKLLRGPKEVLLSPVAMVIPPVVSPLLITWAGFALGLVALAMIWRGWYGLGLLFWSLNRLFDGLDGTFARVTQQQSDFGGYLDILLDMAMYAGVPAALAIGVGTAPAYLSLTLLLVSFYLNGGSWMYLAAILEKRHSGAAAQGEMTTVTMPGGLLGGTETFVFFVLFLLFPGALVPLFLIMAFLTLVTATQRVWWASRALL